MNQVKMILLVDDDPVTHIVIPKMLKRYGLSVDSATNGREAIVKHESNDYDMILMDLSMPVMDGLAAARHIRSECTGTKREVIIIGVTGHDSDTDRDQCISAGMNDCIVKPYQIEQLLEKVNVLRPQG